MVKLIGHGFTHEEYRKKGVVSHPFSKKIIAGGDLPETNTVDANSTILKRVGFLDLYKTMWLEVKTTEL